MPIRSYDFVPVLRVKVSRPYFSTRLQVCTKNLVSGDEAKVITAHDVIKTVVRVGYIKQAILLPI